MQVSILLAGQIAQLFLILLMGYALVRTKLLKARDSRVLSVIMVYLATPCTILNAFQIEDTPEVRAGLVFALVTAAGIHLLLLAMAWLLGRLLKLDVIEKCTAIYSNAGALVVPLVQALLGEEYVIYSCGFMIVQLVLLWTHCCTSLRGKAALSVRGILCNVNLLSILAGAAFYLLHIQLPELLTGAMSTAGGLMGPLGMLLAGMAIADSPLKKLLCSGRYYMVSALRLLVCPLAVLAVLWAAGAAGRIPDGKNILMTVYLAAITPACATLTSMAQLYDRDSAHSSALYVQSTLLSILTMPVMIGLFDRVI